MILPIFAGLERIPTSLLEASADLGGRGWMTFRRVILPLSIPAVVAGSIFTFSLTLGDYIVPGLVSTTQFIGNVIFINVGARTCRSPPPTRWCRSRSCSSTCSSRGASAPSRRSDAERSGRTDRALRVATASVLAFIYVPLSLVVIYAFNESGTSAWPPSGFTLHWVGEALAQHRPPAGVPDLDRVRPGRDRDRHGPRCAGLAGGRRYSFFGRESISFVVILADRPARHRDGHGAVDDVRARSTSRSGSSPSSSAMRRSASCSSTTTRSPACDGSRARSRRRRRTSARTRSRRSAT